MIYVNTHVTRFAYVLLPDNFLHSDIFSILFRIFGVCNSVLGHGEGRKFGGGLFIIIFCSFKYALLETYVTRKGGWCSQLTNIKNNNDPYFCGPRNNLLNPCMYIESYIFFRGKIRTHGSCKRDRSLCILNMVILPREKVDGVKVSEKSMTTTSCRALYV